MANPEHLKILEQGVEVWNRWREENRGISPDLSKALLTRQPFHRANFANTNFKGAILRWSSFYRAILHGAIFDNAIVESVSFHRAKSDNSSFKNANLLNTGFFMAEFKVIEMQGANLKGADLRNSIFYKTNFNGADLTGANLSGAHVCECSFNESILTSTIMVDTRLDESTVIKSNIYGISAWNIKKDSLIQKDLIITPPGEPEITVDDLEVAQFIYLLLNNQNIRNVIDTITSKAVLILGRFTPERKVVLDAIKEELRLRNYLPIVFDFENSSGKSVDETVNLLARMSRFVIADITDAKSISQELRGIVPDSPSIPIVPLIWKEQSEYGMFDFFRKFPQVLPLHEYESSEALLDNILPAIITPAEQKVEELRRK